MARLIRTERYTLAGDASVGGGEPYDGTAWIGDDGEWYSTRAEAATIWIDGPPDNVVAPDGRYGPYTPREGAYMGLTPSPAVMKTMRRDAPQAVWFQEWAFVDR